MPYVFYDEFGSVMKQARSLLVAKLEMFATSIPAPTSETSDHFRRQALCTLNNLVLK
jgi:hypothetical protein